MRSEIEKAWGAFKAVRGVSPHSLALMEGPKNCNRACSYCKVPNRWNAELASTVAETHKQIDWLYSQGFRVLNYVGGEPLAGAQFEGGVVAGHYAMNQYGCFYLEKDYTKKLVPFTTKEGLTFVKHTLSVVKYASRKGMFTNVTTNGDFLDNSYYLGQIKRAELDMLTLSLHSVNEASLRNIVGKARAVAQAGIIPLVSVVFTKDRTDAIPKIARTCAANGILFSTAIVQEIGGGFSAVPNESQIPTLEQQRKVFESLLRLKRVGFVRDNRRYLNDAINFPGNSWKCNLEKDAFVHIRSEGKGEIGVCSEVRTGFDTDVDLKSDEWRQRKRRLVESCEGCLYSCYFESENPDLRGDLRTFINMALIKLGRAGLVRRLGQKVVGSSSEILPVPQSGLEKEQAEINNYYKLHNKLKRKGWDLINVIEMPFAYTFAIASLARIYWEARKQGVNTDDVSKTFLTGIVYPGIFESSEEKRVH